jgi:hypothetical protein
MPTMEAKYSPLDLLRGRWLWVEERPGITLFRLAPTYARARIAGVIVILLLYWSVRDNLPAELGQWEFLFVLGTIWLLIGRWNKGAVVLAVVENDEAAARQFPKELPRETVAVSQVIAVEVRDNLWKERGVVELCQVFLHRKDSRIPLLVYQHWRTRHKHVLEMATRLAERWVVRLLVDDSP